MAITIPSSIPNKASAGEKKLFTVLAKKLPDTFRVWYEPFVNERRPDFIILGPEFGLLVIEVKGWYGSQILKANADSFEVLPRNQDINTPQLHQSPLRQGRNYLDSLSQNLETYKVLLQQKGRYQGHLAFPVGVGVVMSNLSQKQASELALEEILPFPTVAYSDELREWETIDGEALIQRLEQMLITRFSFSPLTEDQISTIKGIIYPEIVIGSKPACPQSVPGGFSPLPNHLILSTLDAKQEALAKSIGSGHRILFGVSGSGKTLLLISRAKMLVQQNSQARILVLCFNISLSSMLRSILYKASDDNQAIEVHHFHAWTTEVVGKPITSQAGVNYDEYVGQQTLETLKSYHQQQKWDAILIDEAHTFIPIWFQCCVQALKDPENGDLMIVADGSQSIYKRSDFTWKSVGIKAQGRTISKKFDLDRNYRNTKEILTAAWNILKTGPKVAQNSDSDEITFPIVEPSQALRQGKFPQIYYLSSKNSLETTVAQKVKTQLDGGYNESEIAIVYRKASKEQLRQLQDELQKVGIEFFWVSKNQKSKANYSIEKPGIRLITTLSCLGLEFEVVIIPWMENFSDCSKRSEGGLLARRELYVAMTRAKEELYLFSSENNPFLQELDNSNYFKVTDIN